jgi:hypothetical protein
MTVIGKSWCGRRVKCLTLGLHVGCCDSTLAVSGVGSRVWGRSLGVWQVGVGWSGIAGLGLPYQRS